jgi:hypothetical protein
MDTLTENAIGAFWVRKDSGALVRVKEVDNSFAYIEVLTPAPATFSMAVAQYDTAFVDDFRPATTADLRRLTPGKYRPPANATPSIEVEG